MRVTDKMLFDLATRDGGRARARLEEAISRAATGVRLAHPKDDPAGAGLVTLERARAARLDAIAETAGRASDELLAADGALGEVASGIARARELAVQLSSATYGAAERAAGATEVRGLLAAAIASLDAKVGGRYVLGGRLDGAPPFDASGAYVGDAGVREVEIAPGVRQAASLRADVAVGGAGGGADVLATLSALAAALEANDPAGAAATLGALATGTEQVAHARAEAGAALATLDAAVAASRLARDGARERVAALADADPIEAASALALAERALDAALTATVKGFDLTLLGKLG
jgi:flagellin-like hook-associated protein FlgL